MKKVVLNLAVILGCAFSTLAQEKSTVAVTNPNVEGLYVTPEIASKLIRLELVKLDQYSVYDEFDMAEVYKKDSTYENDCMSKSCLTRIGQDLGVDYVVSGSFDALGNKIIISLKFIDIKNSSIFKTGIKEFDNQEVELQRMTEVLIREMHGLPVDKELEDRLKFKNEVITSDNVGKINNSGPRVGLAYMTGSVNEFALRDKDQHGLGMRSPVTSMIGYQFEGQYVGTENFSALIEGLVNVTGLEQGQFIPSVALMNGFRFGKAGWEIAFGPAFGLKKVKDGFFDTEGLIGNQGDYYNRNDFYDAMNDIDAHPENFDANGTFINPELEKKYGYEFSEQADRSGDIDLNAMFVIAAGRSFRAGSLNIPVNVFYSSREGGGMIGMSVGFNVMKSKKPINPRN